MDADHDILKPCKSLDAMLTMKLLLTLFGYLGLGWLGAGTVVLAAAPAQRLRNAFSLGALLSAVVIGGNLDLLQSLISRIAKRAIMTGNDLQ